MAYKDKEGNKEPPFIKVYLDDLGKLTGLTGTQREVLDGIIRKVKYGNEIHIDKGIRDNIISSVGCTLGSFKNCLSVLVKKSILIRQGKRGNYILNPYLMFKGKVGDRAKLIIQYDELGNRESIELEVIDE